MSDAMRNKILAYAVGAVCLVASPSMQAINVYAAEAYSSNWTNEKADLSGTWHYYMNDGSLCTSAWVHDKGQWYLLDANGNMLTGVVKSNGGKYYLLDTVRGTGTYGKMLTNGSVYNGVTISASVNADDEGSLSADTIAQLRAANVNVDNVPNVENTKHVEGGVVVYANTSTPQPQKDTPDPILPVSEDGGSSDPTDTSDEIDFVLPEGDGWDKTYEWNHNGGTGSGDINGARPGISGGGSYEGPTYKFEDNSSSDGDYSSWFDGLDPSGAGGATGNGWYEHWK